MKVTYRVRTFIDRYRCIDKVSTIYLHKAWWYGNILYGYADRYNVKTISKDDIISIEEA